MTEGPGLVSVVMPVYNGEAFLEEAIRSVLAQTYQHFDLTIVNNCSRDRTRAIAAEFASKDRRVRIHDNTEFLDVVGNHNMAFSQISAASVYCKLLSADDWFFPHCIEELVRVAEAHPTVGMVTSYVLSGTRVGWDGLPYPSTFMKGRDVCRLRLLEGIKVFGGPSASLIRSSILRQRVPFYNPLNYHGDNEAYFELLQRHDFGFVHQVLSYNRRGEDSRTTAYLDRVHSYPVADIDELTKFGPGCLTADELRTRLAEVTSGYYRFLGRSVFEFRGREFWDYHTRHVRNLGYPLKYGRLARYTISAFLDIVLNPKRTLEGLWRRLTRIPAAAAGSTAGRPGRHARALV